MAQRRRIRVEPVPPLDGQRYEAMRCTVGDCDELSNGRPWCAPHSPYAQSVAREAERRGATGWQRGRDL
jgi:hypothetical protein